MPRDTEDVLQRPSEPPRRQAPTQQTNNTRPTKAARLTDDMPQNNLTTSPTASKPVVVVVTGAAGQIGYALLPLIARGLMFGPTQRVALRLLEITPALPALSGVRMELVDGAYPLLDNNSIVCTDDTEVAFTSADVAILVGAFPRKAGMERSDLLRKNAAIFKTQGMALERFANKNVKVVVVGNPANTNAMILSKYATSIPKHNITALTRLDHNRMVGQLANVLNVSSQSIDGVCIWGNHSSTQYPDVTRTTVNGLQNGNVAGSSEDTETKVDVIGRLGGYEKIAHEFIPGIQQRGANIIKARGASSALSAANAIVDHVCSWWCGDNRIVSMAVPSELDRKNEYGIEHGIYFSYPVRCTGDGTYEIVSGITIDPFSDKYIRASADELHAEREDALAIVAAEK